MSELRQPDFFKAIEARIQLLFSRTSQLIGGLAHRQFATNGVAVGPAATIAFTCPPFISKTGQVKITAYATVTGSTGAVDGDVILFTLLRDGTALVGAPLQQGNLGVNVNANGIIVWDDLVVAGSSHTYAIQAIDNSGGGTHTIEFLGPSGSSGGFAAVVCEDMIG